MKGYINLFLGFCCSVSLFSCSNNLDETVYSLITEQPAVIIWTKLFIP